MSAQETSASSSASLAILGGGNLGQALARGFVRSGTLRSEQIHVTSLHLPGLEALAAEGFPVGSDNLAAIRGAGTVLIAVQPQQITDLLDEIRGELDPSRHKVISVVSGVTVAQLRDMIPAPTQVARAMPNTAVSIGESMTCLSADANSVGGLEEAEGSLAAAASRAWPACHRAMVARAVERSASPVSASRRSTIGSWGKVAMRASLS